MAAISPNYLPGSKGIPRNRVVDKAWSAVRSKDRNSVFAGDERNKAYLIWAAGILYCAGNTDARGGVMILSPQGGMAGFGGFIIA